MIEETTVALAVEVLQTFCSRGEITPDEARKLLADFGGIPHTGKDGAEMYLFVGQKWDVEVMTSTDFPRRCILSRVITPD